MELILKAGYSRHGVSCPVRFPSIWKVLLEPDLPLDIYIWKWHVFLTLRMHFSKAFAIFLVLTRMYGCGPWGDRHEGTLCGSSLASSRERVPLCPCWCPDNPKLLRYEYRPRKEINANDKPRTRRRNDGASLVDVAACCVQVFVHLLEATSVWLTLTPISNLDGGRKKAKPRE
jgi:hypothetical protein